MSISFSRRHLLSAVGGAAAALPLLHARPGRAATPTFPTRLLVVTWPNGVFGPKFFPAGDGPLTAATMTPTLAPLAPFASKLLVIGGLDLRNQADAGSKNGHNSTPFVLTGKQGAPFEGTWDGFKYTAGGPSVDQHVAQQLRARGVMTRFPSLALRTYHYKGNDGYVSISGPPIGGKVNAPVPEHEPAKLFETLFGDLARTPEADRRRAIGKSVLSHLHKNVERLGKRLGPEDRMKMQAHLAGVAEIERQLAFAANGSCVAPPVVKMGEDKNGTTTDTAKRISLFGDMLVAAFQCDLTRVATVIWGGPGFAFPAPGQVKADDGTGGGPFFDEHGLAHKQHTNAEGGERRALVDRWFCEQFAGLLGKLDAVKEGSGTMLDNTVVLFANQMSDGYWHGISDLPWIVAGGGKFKTGRTVRHASGDKKNRLPQARLLDTICAAMGVSAEGFSDPAYGGEISGLRG